MQSLSARYLDGLRLTAEHGATLKALGEFQGKQELYRKQTPELLESLREAAIIESSESSNRLEGVTAPHDRIEALVLKGAAPQNRSEQEIAGYRDALNLIHESASDMPFSVNVVLQLHTMLYRYLPQPGGRWKSTQNEIVEKNPDGTVRRVRFVPVTPVATEPAMRDLESGYQQGIGDSREPLILVPLAILDFLCIHPFSDGNGRVARLLTMLLLYHFELDVARYVSLERIFEESKESYYETLEASSQGWHEGEHDCIPWMAYFWGVLLRAHREFEERVGTLRFGRGSKTDLIEAAIRRRVGPFAISDVEADCPGVSRDWIRIVLRRLRDAGQIAARGKGRGAKWVKVRD